jgi:hypothetical protein
LRIRINFIRIRIQHFRLNTDPDPDPIRIQGFNDRKLETKITTEKKIKFFFGQKLQFTYPQASIKNVQVTEEAFSFQKRPSDTLKKNMKFLNFFYFLGLFCPPGSGSTDPIESGFDPDPQPWTNFHLALDEKNHRLNFVIPPFSILARRAETRRKTAAKNMRTAAAAKRTATTEPRQPTTRPRKRRTNPAASAIWAAAGVLPFPAWDRCPCIPA